MDKVFNFIDGIIPLRDYALYTLSPAEYARITAYSAERVFEKKCQDCIRQNKYNENQTKILNFRENAIKAHCMANEI